MKNHLCRVALPAFLCAVSLTAIAAAKIEEQILAPAWKPNTIVTLSPRGMHFASTLAKGNKFVVMIDGAESPEYDQVLNVVPTIETIYYDTGFILSQTMQNQGPVAFCHDGTRWAYAAQIGNDVVVMMDGKEIFRAPASTSAPPVSLMQFTPDGKHLYFYNRTGDTLQSYRLMFDGKPITPAFDQTPQPVFSADGSRWLLSAGKAKQPNEKMLIIDGRDAGYTGLRPIFTPDGKKVVCTFDQKLLVDGKPMMAVYGIDRFRIGASGDIAAIVQAKDQTKSLYLNGKPAASGEYALDVTFSPDGRHWASKCMTNFGAAWWMVVDGKKLKEYKEVSAIAFSPDSTMAVYYGRDDTGWHQVVNGVESGTFGIVRGSVFAKTRHQLAYAGGTMPNTLKLYYGETVSPQHTTIYDLTMSPDGARRAYYATVGPTASEFIVDGEVKGLGGAFGGVIAFSADSKHLMAQARTTNGYDTIYIDGTFLPERRVAGVPKEFTPDSRHLIMTGNTNDMNKMPVVNYYVDGELAAQFSSRGMRWANSPKMMRRSHAPLPFGVDSNPPDPDAKDWEVEADGSIVFIGSTPGPDGYGPIKRVKFTPDPDTTFTTWAAALKEAEAQAVADAAAAKKKAAEDAAAAAAKRKADNDAAVAARNQARQEALNDKKLKALNAQRAKRGLPPLSELP